MLPDGVISIRRFVDQDELAVVDVWFRSGKPAYAFLPMWQSLTRVEATEIFRNEIRRTCDIWVAVNEAAIVGYLAIRGVWSFTSP
jgi:hypothetical protein